MGAENKFRLLLTSIASYARIALMKTNTLQIRAFPMDVNKALKIKAVKLGVTFRELVIKALTEASK